MSLYTAALYRLKSSLNIQKSDMKTLSVLLCLFAALSLSSNASAQAVAVDSAIVAEADTTAGQFIEVDYAQLDDFVKNHPDDYNMLVSRFCVADTTLDLDDIAVIYYGSTCLPQYAPYGRDDKNLNEALKMEDNHVGVLAECEKMLESNAVSLKALYYAFATSDYLGKVENAEKYYFRLLSLLTAIHNSGDGSPDYPMKVIRVNDEYMFIRFALGGQPAGQAFDGKNDIMQILLPPDEDNPEATEEDRTIELYFDISRASSTLGLMFDDKQEE